VLGVQSLFEGIRDEYAETSGNRMGKDLKSFSELGAFYEFIHNI
jgi:hypothetical protein